MLSPEIKNKYRATIGIECHVQLKTKSKLFSAAGNDAREAPPNTLVNHIDFGLPGALPVVNEEAIHLASKMAFALGSVPQKFSKFDRKHYFYPDLPMGYQITQYDQPIVVGGSVEIEVDGQKKKVGITRAHLEADAGKNMHPAGKDYSLVDLNRAGTPLLEIVSEPDIHSPAEAKAYARELYLLAKYADISDANLFYGNMRFDVNVSVNKTDALGTRTETKNLNSFRAVEKAAEYEINRQIELLEKGQKIVQETRGWDDAKQKTTSQRGKEEAHDYRYMPDPDLPPVTLSDKYISEIKNEMPKLPIEIRQTLAGYGISKDVIEDILDVPKLNERIFKAIDLKAKPEYIRRIAFDSLEEPAALKKVEVSEHIKLAEMIISGQLNSSAGKEVLLAKLRQPEASIVKLAEGKVQVSDAGEISKIVEKVLADNVKAAEDVKNGEMKAIGFLVGQVMKESKGKANPQLAQDLIKKQLGL